MTPMTNTTEREEFLRAVEVAKLEAMKELAYGASHEINNPLANIAARAQALLKRIEDPADRRMLEGIHRQAMRAHEMISDLMLFARPPALQKEPISVARVVADAVAPFQELAERQSIHLVMDTEDEQAQCLADPLQIAVAVAALVENSIEAIGESGEVGIAVCSVDTEVEIKVRDSGPGVPAEIRERIFDPFFSGREAGRGLGFGLSKCWRIVTEHGGRVTVASPPGTGATFTIHLPQAVE